MSPDGQILISTSNDDAAIRLWKIGNPLIQPPMIHARGRVVFSPDGQALALIGRDKTIRLYSHDGRLLKIIEAYKEGVSDVKFSPDGKTLISVGGSSVLELSLTGIQYQFTKPQQDYDNSIAKIWNLDGKLVGTVDLWANFIVRQGHDAENKALAVTFNPDGKTVLSGGKRLLIWNLEGPYGTLLSDPAPCGNKQMWDVKSNFNGEMIAVTCGEQIVVFEGNNPAYLLGSHRDTVWRINFSPDGKKLVSASSDNTVKLWDIAEKKELLTLDFKSNSNITSGVIGQHDASFSPDGQTILTAGETGFYLWDFTGKQLSPFTEDLGIGDEEFVGIGISFELDEKNKVPTITRIYDNSPAFKAGMKKGDQVLEINGIATMGLILDEVSQLLSGEIGTQVTLLLSSDNVRYTRSLSREKIRSIRQLANSIYLSAKFSPDGRTIAVSGPEGTLELWNREGQLLKSFKGHLGIVRNLSFSPDGKLLASTGGKDNTVKLWNVTEGQEFKTLKHNAAVDAISFSPDGQLLATASADNIVRIWKIDGTLLKPLLGEVRPIYNYFGADRVDITPDGKTLVLGPAYLGLEKKIQTHDFHGRLLNVFGMKKGRQWEWFSPEGHLQVSRYGDNDEQIEKVVMSPDGKLLASFSERIVYLYATDGSWGGKKLEAHSDKVSDISFSLDSKLLASVGQGGTLKIWNVDGINSNLRHATQIPTFAVPFTSFGVDGLLAYKVRDIIGLWNSDGSPLHTLDTGSILELFRLADIGDDDSLFYNYEISFTPDGETLVTEVYRRFSPEEIGTKNSGKVVYKMAFWSFNLDYLLKRGCDLISPFLKGESSQAQKERFLCTDIDYAGTLLLDEGDYLANRGEVEAATAKFTEALQKNPKLHFDARQRAQQLAVSFLVAEGERLANQNDVQGAIAKFQKALEWNPSLGIHAEEKARQLDEKAKQSKAQKFLEEVNRLSGEDKTSIQEIINAYIEVLKSAPHLQVEVLKQLEGKATRLIDYKGQPKEAVPILQKIVEINSNHENAWSLMGNALFKQNKLDEAIVAYEKQLAVKPDHEAALQGLMSVFAAQQKLATEGLAFINKLLEDNSKHSSAWYILGSILTGQKKYEEALVAFKKQVEVNPNHKDAWFKRGQVSVQLGKFDEVVTAFDNLLSKFTEEGFDKGQNNYVWYFLGFALEQQAKLLEQQGKSSEKENKLQDARLAYSRVDFRHADYYLPAQERLVKLMSDLGPLWRERAIEHLRQQLSSIFTPFNSDHQIPMGLIQLEVQLLLDSDRQEEAMMVYNKIIQRVDSTIQQIENEFQSRCVKSDNSPQNEDCIKWKGWKDKKITDMLFKRAVLAEKVDDLKRTEQDLQYILEIDPGNVSAFYELSYTLTDRTDRYQEAYDLLKRVLELESENPLVFDRISWVLDKMGKSTESLEYQRKAQSKIDRAISSESAAKILKYFPK